MSKFIVLANSGEVLSTHKSLDLAEKSAKKLGGYVAETESTVKKGDLFELPVDDVETFEADQELAECDKFIAEQKIKLELSSSFKIGDVIETMYKDGTPTGDRHTVYAVDNELRQVYFDAPMLVTGGYDNCRKFDRVYLVTNDEPAETKQFIDAHEDFNDAEPTSSEIEQAEKEADDFIAAQRTITYIAKPSDSRCSWWCVQVPEDQQLDGTRISAPYLRKGADLELKSGDMLIDSEANHHRKNRGYNVVLVVCDGEKVQYLHPTAQRKAFIKANGGQDLMHESGDVNGCIRIAVWLRRQPDLKVAIEQLQQV
jgi:hypothetical protein